MTEEEILGVLVQIIEPLTGKFLAEAAAWRLYNELARVDRDALKSC